MVVSVISVIIYLRESKTDASVMNKNEMEMSGNMHTVQLIGVKGEDYVQG